MAWEVSNPGAGRYVRYSRTGIVTADRDSRIELDGVRGQPVKLTPTGPTYRPTGRDDEAGLYLHALRIVPGPVEVTGTPPTVPGGATTGESQEGIAD